MEKNLQEVLSKIEGELLFHSSSSLEAIGYKKSDSQSRKYGTYQFISDRVPNAPPKIFREKGDLIVGQEYLLRVEDSQGLNSEYPVFLEGFYYYEHKKSSSENSPSSLTDDSTHKLFLAAFTRPKVEASYTREVLDDRLNVVIEEGVGVFPQTPLNLLDRDPASRYFTLDPSIDLLPIDSIESFAEFNHSEIFGVGYDTHDALSELDEKRLFWKNLRKKGSYLFAASILVATAYVVDDMAKQNGVSLFEEIHQFILKD